MKLPFRVNKRERKFLIIGGVAALLIVIFNIYSSYSDFRREADTVIDSRMLTLEKQLRKLAGRDELKKTEEEIKKELSRYENLFLKGNKPPVAAAELQNTLKEMSSGLNIEIRVERALSPVDSDFYIQIPVEIGFTTSTDNLRILLEKLRQVAFLVTVSEMKVRVTNINKPGDINVTLVVTGFIRKTDSVTSGSEEGKNVA